MNHNARWWLLLLLLCAINVSGQLKPVWTKMPALPDKEGFAGMFAGVSNGTLFCMGGANFPDKKPWEGGVKKWYNQIFMLKGDRWILLPEKLITPLAYGVSVSYDNHVMVIGGSYGKNHSRKVMAYTWNNRSFLQKEYPDLPLPLANMAGTLVGNCIIIAGGSIAADEPPVNKCFGLDLSAIDKGWFEFPEWPGVARTQPVCASYNGRFYLFSGEAPGVSNANLPFRNILQDAYYLTPVRKNGAWNGEWQKISPMPKGVSASGSPVPVLSDGRMLFWGGVDAVTACYKDQATHPGIMKEVIMYDAATDTWNYSDRKEDAAARVTLPVVYWNCSWVYISGEIKPGVRTNTVYSLK